MGTGLRDPPRTWGIGSAVCFPALEYRELVSDFAKRTLVNLDHIKSHELAGGEEAYFVTQLWNSLAGLIVLPKEVELHRIRPIAMIELIAEAWPDITTSDWRPDTLPEFVVALRNAVCHWNVTFEGPNESVGVLEDVARRVAAEFLRDFAAAA